MASLKSLAKDTAIYGMSSIVGRFLNYLLVPLYTTKMHAETGDYGIVTNLYSYTAIFLVLLTFGMETTFFRFANKEGETPTRVYSTTLFMVGGVGLLFLLILYAFLPQIASLLQYPDHPDFVAVMFTCVAIDAFQAIPFAYLRYQKRPIKFAALKLLFILLNITLNLVYFILVPYLYQHESTRALVSGFFNGTFDVGFVFYINLACTAFVTLFFKRELTGFRYVYDRRLAQRMWHYSWPILALGIIGILNMSIDKIIFPFVTPLSEHDANVQLGIYGACVKIAMIMTLITQAFRYAYEPFVFNKSKDTDSRATYAAAMKYFLIFSFLAFLIVIGYLDLFKYIVAPSYHEGMRVTPIVMTSGILLGIFFNLSLWYKLTDKTIYGLWLSLSGCIVLIAVNILFIPRFGYMACAWGGVVGYGLATLLSYYFGQKHYPIAYPLKSLAVYTLMTAAFATIMFLLPDDWPLWQRLGINTILIALFVGHVLYHDLPVKQLPVIGKYFR